MTPAQLVSIKERIVCASFLVELEHADRGPLFTPAERDFLLDAINATHEAAIADGRVEYHDPPNRPGRIDHLWAALSVDDTGEGLCAAPVGGSAMLSVPLIAADRQRLDSLRPLIRTIARVSKRVVRIVQFTTRKDIEIIRP